MPTAQVWSVFCIAVGLLSTDAPSSPQLAGVALACGLEAAGPASRLRHLLLSRNALGDATAAALGRALAAQSPVGALCKLLLAVNRIGPSGARGLAQGLRDNFSLTDVNLRLNPLGDERAAAIYAALLSKNGGSGRLELMACSLELGNGPLSSCLAMPVRLTAMLARRAASLSAAAGAVDQQQQQPKRRIGRRTV